ncbi:MAG: hypothetical protein JF887_00165 [Candidatus Dormibacteraeota bacterium]|uniref:Uncharacterized protein n=1 Tax=Candidatus Amunia macphersoniae TaxID=3127014 RepID=A0A934KJS1_9BACT|nr:hypothetical protein [Candidatus Dormibacteraeota bacterium]
MARAHGGLIGLGVAALIAAGATGLSPLPTRAAAPPTPGSQIGFGVPTVVDPIHTNGEPDIAINPKDHSVYNSGPTGTGTQRSTWFGSLDQGQTFRPVTQGTPPNALVTFPAPQPGGGDTDINFDRSGKQYFSDLYALTCLRVAVTADDGATTSQNVYPGGCAGVPAADRQWLAVYDPATPTPVAQGGSAYGHGPLVYMEYNNLTTGSQWTKSTDGLTYTTASTAGRFGADGYPAIDQVSGKVFETSGGSSTGGAAQTAACHATHCLLMNIGTPNASGNLTFMDEGASPKLVHIADTPTGDPDSLFTVLSMDTARNLYVTYAINPDNNNPSQRQVFVSASSYKTGWTVWTTPVQVSGLLSNDKVNVFPWGKAGGPGLMDAVWYGANKLEDPSAHSTPPKAWNVFMSQLKFQTDTDNAVITSAAPQIIPTQATPHPMHYDDICLKGTECILSAGNRNLADFFVVTLDDKGAAQIVYDDTSNGLIQSPLDPSIPQVADHSGAGVITVAHQSSGPSALDGSDVATTFTGTTSMPMSGLTRTSGKAKYPVIGGTNVPGMDLLGSHMSLADGTLTVTSDVLGDPKTALADLAARGNPATLLHFVTRWQLGNTIYYGAMQVNPIGGTEFYAGRAQSVDLCSVSACFPHITTYPEPETANRATNPGSGLTEPGALTCPAAPATGPCQITIRIKAADVGTPTSSSLLEEVGSYALSSTHQQGATSNLQAQADNVPLEIDGICCYNFGVTPATQVPESPWAALLPGLGLALIAAGVGRSRRARGRAVRSAR